MIADKHLWGHQRTVYRDKSIWVVEIFGKAGGMSSLHYHQHMVNSLFVCEGVICTQPPTYNWRMTLEAGLGTQFGVCIQHCIFFETDARAFETYYALPGHEIDPADIVRLSDAKAPDASPA